MRDRSRVWQTKPLECWGKFKELRTEHYREVASANERGKILVTGSAGAPFPILSGFGDDVVFLSGEAYGGSAGTDGVASLSYMTAVEERGYARDMCSYMRNYLGSMFRDRFFFGGGPFPKPALAFSHNFCDAGHAKWYQIVAEHHGVPLIIVDSPIVMDGKGFEQKNEYVAAQIADAVDQMERILGRRFDDEKAIAATRNFVECEAVWADLCLASAAIPAPLDLKMLFALMPVPLLLRGKPECLSALEALHDEVKDRVAHQIAASETERIRLVTDEVPPWSFLPMFRGLQDRGVVFVGIRVYLVNTGEMAFHDDGSITREKTEIERGVPLNTRDDLVRHWARSMTTHQVERGLGDPNEKFKQLWCLYKHWQADGVVMHYNRGCPLQLSYQPEVKARMESEGIPVTVFEANGCDARDTDATQILKRLTAFAELLEVSVAPVR